MLQNVLLFIHLKMFKIGSMLNVIHCNKPCVACCSVRHRTTPVHLVILMWITSCKIITAWLAALWCGFVAMCNVQHIVTNHTESQVYSGTKSSTAFSLHWWMTLHVLIQKIHYSLTSCQLHFPVPLSSFLAHLLALSHIFNPF